MEATLPDCRPGLRLVHIIREAAHQGPAWDEKPIGGCLSLRAILGLEVLNQ